MPSPQRWSRIVRAQRGEKARVYEREPGGVLYVDVHRDGRRSRCSLGYRDRERALAEVHELLRRRTQSSRRVPHTRAPLTLGQLFGRYTTEGKYLPDGSLKTERYVRHCISTGENLARFFGKDFAVVGLTPDRIQEYVQARRAGTITGRAVRANCIERELAILKAACNWARGVVAGGTPLLAENPLDKFRIPSEKNPKRPLIEDATVEALLAVAHRAHPWLPLLITLARTTGRRIGSILGLRWDDVDFQRGTIRWRAELDKGRRTWTVPLPERACPALQAFRAAYPAIGSALLFPHPKPTRAGEPVTRDLASYWLRKAYALVGVATPDGSLWHAFRRLWATERKDLPLTDVAAAGGWKDVTTLLECYQQPDEETLRRVMNHMRPRRTSNACRQRLGAVSQ